MRTRSGWETSVVTLALLIGTVTVAHGQTLNVLFNFDLTSGGTPYGPLVQGIDGNFYGTTVEGGNLNCEPPYGCGTIFRITPSGTLTTIHQFCNCGDGLWPYAGLVLGTDGNFYGTTDSTIFKINTAGKFTTLYSFGYVLVVPYGPLIQGSDGDFYGMTHSGGSTGNGPGTVFKITPSGEFTTLYVFCSKGGDCSDGMFPRGGLVEGTDGYFYGTTLEGGSPNNNGTIFRITPSGKFTRLYAFRGHSSTTEDGSNPYGSLIQASDGNFYGTTAGGGILACDGAGCGTIFRFSLSGQYKKIYNFDYTPANARYPYAGLIQGTDRSLYGTTGGGDGGMDYGAIFSLSPSDDFAVLHTFVLTDGGSPFDNLLQATDGLFYGTNSGGGATCCGTVFSLDTGLSPFIAFVHAAGKVGQVAGILGQGFTGTTSVSLNGTPMSFTVVSDTFIKATVPSGATTGYVMVATSNGTLTSNVRFYVIP